MLGYALASLAYDDDDNMNVSYYHGSIPVFEHFLCLYVGRLKSIYTYYYYKRTSEFCV